MGIIFYHTVDIKDYFGKRYIKEDNSLQSKTCLITNKRLINQSINEEEELYQENMDCQISNDFIELFYRVIAEAVKIYFEDIQRIYSINCLKYLFELTFRKISDIFFILVHMKYILIDYRYVIILKKLHPNLFFF